MRSVETTRSRTREKAGLISEHARLSTEEGTGLVVHHLHFSTLGPQHEREERQLDSLGGGRRKESVADGLA